MLESSRSTIKNKNLSDTRSEINIQENLISVLRKEANAILDAASSLPKEAELLVEKILNCSGRVVLSGMGKSGFIGRKIAATFSSVGIPSFFLHPVEALHGDLGMVQPSDLFIALSKSGTGSEFAQLLPILFSQGNFTSLICCDAGHLVDCVDLAVRLPFTKEACLLNLAPTSSSTLMLAFGDALAVSVSNIRGFTKNDFAKFHPAGSLGKNLLLKVSSLMHLKEDLPFLLYDASFQEVLVAITAKKLGVGVVVDRSENMLGIITDGDLRRACEKGASVFEKTAAEIMKFNPKTIFQDMLAYDALVKMEDSSITSLLVEQDEKVVGLVHIHDLIKAGIRR